MKKKIIRSICIAVCVFVVVTLLAIFSPVFTALENKSYDLRVNLFADTHSPSEEISVIVLDQDSIDWAQKEMGWSWPWPRSAYADIVSFFNEANAYSVAFDVLYTEPSIYGDEDDECFAKESTEYGRTIQSVFFSNQYGNQSEWPEYAPFSNFSLKEFDFEVLEESGEINNNGLFPIESLAKSAQSLASVSSVIDSDGIIRRSRLFTVFNENFVPSLALASYSAQDSTENMLSFNAKKYQLNVFGKDFPANIDGSMNLRFRKSLDSYIPYSARDILESKYALDNGTDPLLDPCYFENNYVFFCFYAPGLFDICATPVSTTYPGCGVHITTLDNLLQNDFIANLPVCIVCLLIGLFSVLGVLCQKSSIKLNLLFVPLALVLLVVVVSIGYVCGFNIPFVAPLSALLASYSISFLCSYNSEYKQKRFIRSTFKQYLSPVVIEQLIEHPERVKLGGEERELSIFFSDIEGFTSISEKLNPQQLTEFLNSYLTAMTDIILESGGTIDKYEGDAIIAFWNAPLNQENHSLKALESAIHCQEKLREINLELQKITGKEVKMRIGLNTGRAVVGNMGSSKRFDYTMIGDSVNLAARLEGLNKQFGTYTMCTEQTMVKSKNYNCKLCFRELAKVIVVGKNEAIRVFEPMTEVAYIQKKEYLNIFAKGLELFYNSDIQGALDTFSLIKDYDIPASLYVKKCETLLPYTTNFDGVWRAETK